MNDKWIKEEFFPVNQEVRKFVFQTSPVYEPTSILDGKMAKSREELASAREL